MNIAIRNKFINKNITKYISRNISLIVTLDNYENNKYNFNNLNLQINHKFSTNASNLKSINLPYKELRYDGVEIDSDNMSLSDYKDFESKLIETLIELRIQNKQAVYLKVNIKASQLISIASLHGFKFHHAENDYSTLLLWLPKSENKVPPYATHHIGVGGALVRDDGKILLVKEKTKLSGWKLPGGLVNLGEEFGDAACREVFEETGVEASFQSIVTFRHSHDIQWGRSDIYIICKLKLAGNSIIKIDEEIEDAVWMPLEEFKRINTHPMHKKVIEMLMENEPIVEEHMISSLPGRKPFKIYYPPLK